MKRFAVLSIFVLIGAFTIVNFEPIPEVFGSIIPEEFTIPEWIKHNATFWASGQIDDQTFLNAIEFLLEDGIIVLESNAAIEAAAAQAVADVSDTVATAAVNDIDSSKTRTIILDAAKSVASQVSKNAKEHAMIAAEDAVYVIVNEKMQDKVKHAADKISKDVKKVANDEIFAAALKVSEVATDAAIEAAAAADSIAAGNLDATKAARDTAIAESAEASKQVTKKVTTVAIKSAEDTIEEFVESAVNDATDAAVAAATEAAIESARTEATKSAKSLILDASKNSADRISESVRIAVNESVEEVSVIVEQRTADTAAKELSMSDFEKPNVPEWIKDVAGYWSEDSIDDSTFARGLKFLLDDKIIVVETDAQSIAILKATEETEKAINQVTFLASQKAKSEAVNAAKTVIDEVSETISDKVSQKISKSKKSIVESAKKAALDAVSIHVNDASNVIEKVALKIAKSEAEKASEKVSAKANAAAMNVAKFTDRNKYGESEIMKMAADAAEKVAREEAVNASAIAAEKISKAISSEIESQVMIATTAVVDVAVKNAVNTAMNEVSQIVEDTIADSAQKAAKIAAKEVTQVVVEESKLASDRAAKAVSLAAAEAAEEKAAEALPPQLYDPEFTLSDITVDNIVTFTWEPHDRSDTHVIFEIVETGELFGGAVGVKEYSLNDARGPGTFLITQDTEIIASLQWNTSDGVQSESITFRTLVS